MTTLNSSSWYNAGFPAVGTPRLDKRIVINAIGEFSVTVHHIEDGEAAPAVLQCALFTLEGELVESFLHLEGIEVVNNDDDSVDYVLHMGAGLVPQGNSELRVYADNAVSSHYLCNMYSELDSDASAMESTEDYPSGLEIVEAGASEVAVVYDTALAATALVFFSMQNPDTLVTGVVTANDNTGFTVTLSAPAPNDLTMAWMTASAPA